MVRAPHFSAIILVFSAAITWGAGEADAQVQVLQGGATPTQAYSSYGQAIWWLSREGIQKEIDLVDDQRKKLDEIRADVTKKMRAIYPSLRDLPREKQRTKYAELRKELNEETERRVNKVLLPQQRDRLKQVILQTRLRQGGTNVYTLTSDELAKALGITDEQKVKLRAKQQEIQKKLMKEYQRIREEAQKEILTVLTPEQLAKLKKMQGETYTPPPRKPFRRP